MNVTCPVCKVVTKTTQREKKTVIAMHDRVVDGKITPCMGSGERVTD